MEKASANLDVSFRRKGGRWRYVREFRSGMVGLAPGETLRINVVNTASRVPEALAKLAWALGWTNLGSEPLGRETFSLGPGASAFLDIPAPDAKQRHEVRAEVIVLDDPEGDCVVTLEVFGNASGKTTVLMELRDRAEMDEPSEMGETESLRLQMAMDRVSKMMETLSNLLKKISNTAESITANLK